MAKRTTTNTTMSRFLVWALHPTPTDLLNEENQENQVFSQMLTLTKLHSKFAHKCEKGELHLLSK